MKISKILNIPSKEQKSTILKECEMIRVIMEHEQAELDKKFHSDMDKWELGQSTCPKCDSVDNINIISQKLNTSTSQPFFIFQQPTTNTYTTSETITQCSKCGNQWRKRSRYEQFSYAPIKVNYSNIFINRFIDRKKFPNAFNILSNKSFNDFYAESMYKYFNGKIKLKTLREVYKSIYD